MICPVCGMNVPDHPTADVSQFNGIDYKFCSEMCRQKFDEDPTRYVTDRRARELTSRPREEVI